MTLGLRLQVSTNKLSYKIHGHMNKTLIKQTSYLMALCSIPGKEDKISCTHRHEKDKLTKWK